VNRNPRTVTRWLAYLLFPVACVVLTPLLLAFGALFYLGGLIYAAMGMATAFVQRQCTSSRPSHREPHFEVMAARFRQD
jgi:hypothetical protein